MRQEKTKQATCKSFRHANGKIFSDLNIGDVWLRYLEPVIIRMIFFVEEINHLEQLIGPYPRQCYNS